MGTAAVRVEMEIFLCGCIYHVLYMMCVGGVPKPDLQNDYFSDFGGFGPSGI